MIQPSSCITLLCLTISSSIYAKTDYEAISNTLEKIQPGLIKYANEADQRRKEQEIKAKKEAEEATKKTAQLDAMKQQQLQQDSINLFKKQSTLSPPKEWQNDPIFHKQLLQTSGNSSSTPTQTIFSLSKLYFGFHNRIAYIAYIDTKNNLVLHDLNTKNIQVIKKMTSIEDMRYITLLKNNILISYANKKEELIDQKGQVLKTWNNSNLQNTSDFIIEQNLLECDAKIYDEQGNLKHTINLKSQGYKRCIINTNKNTNNLKSEPFTFEVLAYKNGVSSFYKNNLLISNFKSPESMIFISDLYAMEFSPSYKDKKGPKVIVNLNNPQQRCSLKNYNESYRFRIYEINRRLVQQSPAGILNFETCKVEPIQYNSVQSSINPIWGSKNYLGVFNSVTGEFSLLNEQTLQEKWKVNTSMTNYPQVSIRSRYDFLSNPQTGITAILSDSLNEVALIHYPDTQAGEKSYETDMIKTYKLQTGELISEQKVKGVLKNNFLLVSNATIDAEKKQDIKNGTLRSYQILNLFKPNHSQNYEKFLESIKKDKYETTVEYKNRLKNLKQPFTMNVNIEDYNADKGVLQVSWQSMFINIQIPPTQARQLDEYKNLEIKGNLSFIDENFLLLKDISIQLPNNKTISIPNKEIPTKENK